MLFFCINFVCLYATNIVVSCGVKYLLFFLLNSQQLSAVHPAACVCVRHLEFRVLRCECVLKVAVQSIITLLFSHSSHFTCYRQIKTICNDSYVSQYLQCWFPNSYELQFANVHFQTGKANFILKKRQQEKLNLTDIINNTFIFRRK